ncbi:Helicase associated domain protein [Kitasatospora sp. NPDC092286]|uniref:DEAD/DEAH box helicase n=1 Tax=Kitasatospora sp. NPDC092286 TaxID=3364087 RepID=UPI003821A704
MSVTIAAPRPRPPAAQPLWPHQRDAVDAVCAHLADEERAVLHMACGTGKTRVGAEVAAHVSARTASATLITVPTLQLLSQTVAAWVQALGRPALGRLVAVCSRPDIVDHYRSRLDGWEAVVTSEPDVLADLLRGDRVTVLSTYQSLDVVTAAYQRYNPPPLALTLVDEAHRTVGSAGSLWSLVHDGVRLPSQRRLSMTATPKVVLGGGDVISMDDEKRVGPVAYRLTYGQARSRGLVAHFRLVVPLVTDEDTAAVVSATERPEYLANGGVGISAQMLATQIALLRAAHEYDIKRLITYHRTVADAKAFSRTLPLALDHLEPHERPAGLWAGHIRGSHSQAVRDAVLGRLTNTQDGLVVVSNAKVLSEGVNIPEIDAVAILAPRSEIDSVQIFGRAGRLTAPGTFKIATVFVPAVLGPGTAAGQALEDSAFQRVFSAARALAATDDVLAAYGTSARRELGSQGSVSEREDQPDWLAVTGTAVPAGFADAIRVKVVREVSAPWHEYLGAADQYLADHGSLQDIPRNWTTRQGLPLGSWWHTTRAAFKQNRLPADLREALASIGMVHNLLDHTWDLFVADLTAYHAEFGHVDVPQDYVNTAGRPLGAQVSYRRGRFDKLTEAQRGQLEALGFTRSVQAAAWDLFVADLTAYRDEFGHADVPQDYVNPADRPLGRHVRRRRLAFDKLTAAQRSQLSDLGFTRSVQEAAWDLFVADLTAYRDEFDHVDVPQDYVNPADRPLGRHVRRRRLAFDKLTAAQRGQLKALGFTRSLQEAAWDLFVADLTAHHAEFGHVDVPQDYVNAAGRPLGKQVRGRRDGYDRLTTAQRRQLEALGFTRSVHGAAWDLFVADLTAYREETGHADVPEDYVNAAGRPLGKQVRRRRNRFDQLTEGQRQQLAAVGFERTLLEARWLKHLRAWDAYAKARGTSVVPKDHTVDGFALGRWRLAQLHLLRTGKQPPHRVALLEQHGFASTGPRPEGALGQPGADASTTEEPASTAPPDPGKAPNDAGLAGAEPQASSGTSTRSSRRATGPTGHKGAAR